MKFIEQVSSNVALFEKENGELIYVCREMDTDLTDALSGNLPEPGNPPFTVDIPAIPVPSGKPISPTGTKSLELENLIVWGVV